MQLAADGVVVRHVSGHTFTAYKILTATYSGNVYTEIAWATVTDAAKTALIALNTDDKDSDGDVDFDDFVAALGAAQNDDDLALAVAAYVNDNPSAFSDTAEVTSGTTVLGAGLWVLVDTSTAANVDAVNRTLLYASNGSTACTVISKVDKITSDKYTTDVNDSTETSETTVKSADYDIGDHVPYVITAKLPADYADYDAFYLKFFDKISAGLTYDGNAKIFYGDSDTSGDTITLVKGTTDDDGYTPYTYEIADAKATDAPDELKALGAGAVIRIEYTCTLNENAVMTVAGNPNTYYVEYSNGPNQDGHGTTTPTTVIVFTYKLIVNKVDGDNKPLTGADFKLQKWNGTDWADYATDSVGQKAKSDAADGTKNCVFTFKGLDDGKYQLVETATPEGFNSIDPIVFNVTATHTASGVSELKITDENGAEITDFSVTLTGDITAATNIKNQAGVTLPSTGGIGTTIFYIVGAVLVLGAAAVILARRKAEQQ